MAQTEAQSPRLLAEMPPLTVATMALALLGLPLFALFQGVTDTAIHPIITIGVYWALALFVVGIAVQAEKLSLGDIGFRAPSLVDGGYILATSVLILLVYIGTPPLIEALGLPVSETTSPTGGEAGIGMALALAVTVGVVEEILYRGYPIERLLAYTDSPVIAGGLTWFVFTAAHAVNWPIGSLLQTSLVAGVLTVIYLHRRTLVPVMGAHVLVWVFAILGQAYG